MKKVLLVFFLFLGLFVAIACNDKGPATPGPFAGGANPTSTPAPMGPQTPTPVFLSNYGTSASPNGLYYEVVPNLLHVATGEVDTAGGGNPTMFGVYTVGAGTLTGGIAGNAYVIGYPTPGAVPPWEGTTLIAQLPQAYAYSAGYYALLDSSASGAATLFIGCWGFHRFSVPSGESQFPTYSEAGYGGVPLRSPNAVAGDSMGTFYVTDTGNAYVNRFGGGCVTGPPPNPPWLHRWNGLNSSFPFIQPNSVAVDANDNVWVGDAGYFPTRIYQFSSGGTTILGTWNAMSNCTIAPNGLAVDQSASCGGVPGPCIYISDIGNGGQVEVYTSTGVLMRTRGDPDSPNQFLPFRPGPIALIGNPVQYMIVGDTNNDMLHMFGP